MLEDLDLKTGQIASTSDNVGKVINNYECYICTVLKSKAAEDAKVRKQSVFKIIKSGRS